MSDVSTGIGVMLELPLPGPPCGPSTVSDGSGRGFLEQPESTSAALAARRRNFCAANFMKSKGIVTLTETYGANGSALARILRAAQRVFLGSIKPTSRA